MTCEHGREAGAFCPHCARLLSDGGELLASAVDFSDKCGALGDRMSESARCVLPKGHGDTRDVPPEKKFSVPVHRGTNGVSWFTVT